MRPHRLPALGATAVIAATSLVAAAVLTATPSAASTPTTTLLTGEVVHDLASYTDLGAVAPGAPMRVAVSLAYDKSARDAAYTAMYTKGSPSYGQFLTPAQFQAQFGASPTVAKSVATWATAKGLQPVYASPDGSYLELVGTAQQVDDTFAVTENTYRTATGTFTANAQAPTVPVGVGAVLGLTSLTVMKTAHTAKPAQDTCVPGECTGILTPTDVRSIYDVPSTDTGQGQMVAIFGEGQLGEVVSDLRHFETDHNMPVVPIKEALVGDNGQDNSGVGEWDLDSDASTGMSPNLQRLDYYFGSDLSDASIGGTYSAWANDPDGPLTGNSSFGGPEALEYLGGFALEPLLQQAAMEGRTMFASSGDGGGSCLPGANGVTNDGAPCVEYPAVSDYVVGVGGTVLYSATTSAISTTQATPATRADEYSWTYSGGGQSDYIPAPSYQVTAFPGGVGVPCTMGTSVGSSCRGVPDVSAVSGDIATNGYSVYSGGEETESGGTSLSSPLWAGMWAGVVSAHPVKGATCSTTYSAGATTLGFAQPVLYAIGNDATLDPTAFFDVGGLTDSMQATNGQQQTLPRSAADPTGYDYVSGLGTPDIGVIAKAVDCGSVTSVAKNKSFPPVDIVTYTSNRGCGANGQITDPAGDETPASPATTAYDLTAVNLHSTATTFPANGDFGIHFNATVSDLTAAAANDVNFAFEFKYGGGAYAVTVDTGATPTYSLYQRVFETTPVGLAVEEPPTLLATIRGFVDMPSNTVQAFLPYASFNSAVNPTKPLKKGSILTGIVVYTNTGPATTAIPNDFNAEPTDQANFYQCTYKSHPESQGKHQ